MKNSHNHITLHIDKNVYKSLSKAGKILNETKDMGGNFEIQIAIKPDDLLPQDVYDNVTLYIKSCIYALAAASQVTGNVHVEVSKEMVN